MNDILIFIDMHNYNSLISRVKETCNSNNMSFLPYLFDDK